MFVDGFFFGGVPEPRMVAPEKGAGIRAGGYLYIYICNVYRTEVGEKRYKSKRMQEKEPKSIRRTQD